MGISYKILIFFYIIILSSCSGKTQNNNIDTIIIDPDNMLNQIDLSPFLEDEFKVIKLGTNEDNLISKVKKVVLKHDYLFVLDETSQVVYMFDTKGNFIHQIGTRGGGPEEYTILEDFYVDNKNIYLLDAYGDVLVFDLEGHFNKRVKLPFSLYSDRILVKNQSIYFINNYRISGSDNNRFYYYNIKNGNLNCQLPFDRKTANAAWGLGNQVSEYKDEILVFYAMDNNIYEIVGESIVPKYEVKFSSRELPETLKSGDKLTILLTCVSQNYIHGFDAFTNMGNYLLADYMDGRECRVTFINKENLSAIVGEWFIISKLGKLYGTNISTQNDGTLFLIQDAHLFKDAWEGIYAKNEFASESDRTELEKIASEIDSDENPVVFVFRVKN